MHPAFNRLGEAIGAYQGEDSTTWVLPVGSTYGCLTMGDLRAAWEQVGALLAEVKDLKAGAAEHTKPRGCCGHGLAEHSDEGCLNGWAWTGANFTEGCGCEMQGPLKLREVQNRKATS